MPHTPPRTTLVDLGPLPFHGDDRRKYWDTLCQIGPVVYVDKGWFGDRTYFITTRRNVLAVLRDSATYERVSPHLSRSDRKIVQRALSDQAVKREVELELRSTAAQALTAVGTANFYEIHRSAAPHTPGSIEHDFSVAMFKALAGAPPDMLARLAGAAPGDSQYPVWSGLGQSQFLSRLPDGSGALDLVNHVTAAGFHNFQESVLLVMLALTVDPNQRLKLHQRPDLIPSFVDQLLTLQGVASLTIVRRNSRGVSISGYDVPEGSRLELCIGPVSIEAFHAGDRQHDLTFGYGRHRCIGARLTRRALTILTEECLKLWT